MTDWQERAEKAEARIVQLEALIQQYEEKLKLARLITWRAGDEGISPLASPILSDKPPLTSLPDSGSALRGDDPDPAGIAACLRSCAQTIIENIMDGPSAARYLHAYADTVAGALQRTSGPPTEDLAASLNSNTEAAPDPQTKGEPKP